MVAKKPIARTEYQMKQLLRLLAGKTARRDLSTQRLVIRLKQIGYFVSETLGPKGGIVYRLDWIRIDNNGRSLEFTKAYINPPINDITIINKLVGI